MRIGLDVGILWQTGWGGIPHYVESLLLEFCKQPAGEEEEEELVLIGRRSVAQLRHILEQRGIPYRRPGVTLAFSDLDLRIGVNLPALARTPLETLTRKIDGRLLLPIAQRFNESGRSVGKLSVLHHTNFLAEYCATLNVPHVVTIHDVISLLYPQYFKPNFFDAAYAFARDRAALVLTISECSRQDIITHLGVPEDRVRVTYLGVRSTLRRDVSPEETAACLAKFGLTHAPYALSVATLDPRKNFPRLIAAFAALIAEPGMDDLRLVLTGSRYTGTARIESAIEQHGLADRVLLTDYVTDTELAALMAGCGCFVYPSLYEGFGLPVLEAMAMGAPVVTSNVSSLPEVAGDAALLVDPTDSDAIADAMRRVLTDDALANELRRRGRAREKEFSWERAAAQHRQAYREVASG